MSCSNPCFLANGLPGPTRTEDLWDKDLSYLLLRPEPEAQEENRSGGMAQRGIHKQQRLSINSNTPASAPCPAEVAVGAGHSGGCLRTWGVQREDGLAWPQQPGPWGPCSEEQTHKSSTESPFPPRLLPLRGSGWGTPIVSLSGHEQTKKRLPGAAGCSLSPSSVSWSSDWRRHPHSLSLPCSLEATWGFGQA